MSPSRRLYSNEDRWVVPKEVLDQGGSPKRYATITSSICPGFETGGSLYCSGHRFLIPSSI